MSRVVYMPLCVCGSWRTTFRTRLSPSPCIPWVRLRLAGLYDKGFYPLSHPTNPTIHGFIEYLVCCVLYVKFLKIRTTFILPRLGCCSFLLANPKGIIIAKTPKVMCYIQVSISSSPLRDSNSISLRKSMSTSLDRPPGLVSCLTPPEPTWLK